MYTHIPMAKALGNVCQNDIMVRFQKPRVPVVCACVCGGIICTCIYIRTMSCILYYGNTSRDIPEMCIIVYTPFQNMYLDKV